MTGAGSATAAFVKSDGFLSIPGTPTYYRPGRDVSIDDVSLDRALQRLREEDKAEAVDSLSTGLEGALSASWVVSADTHADVRDIIFNDGGGGFTPGQTALSRWYLGVDYLSDSSTQATAERVLKGVHPLSYELTYESNGIIRANATFGFADEEFNTSVTPGSITGPTDGNDLPFHAAEFSVNSSVQTKLNSATLSVENISRPLPPDDSPVASDAILAAPETTLQLDAVYSDDNQLELAYGSADSTSTQDLVDNVTGQLALDIDGTSVATYTLPKLKSAEYAWSALADAETDTAEQSTWHVNGGVSIA
jgi:hypothetical protein